MELVRAIPIIVLFTHLNSMSEAQVLLPELQRKLWDAAGRLYSLHNAAIYNLWVFGLIYLKYISDSFARQQTEIEAILKELEGDFFMEAGDYRSSARNEESIRAELEERYCHIKKNVFWCRNWGGSKAYRNPRAYGVGIFSYQ